MASQPSYQRAVVKLLPSEPNLTITLTLAGKQRNLDRPRNEPLEKSLARIQKSAEPQGDKKRQRRNQTRPSSQQQQQQQSFETRVAAPEPPSQSAGSLFVGLHSGSTPLDPLIDPGKTTNEEAWKPGHLLRVGDASYVVELNPPIVQGLEAHGQLFVGIPVVPTPKLLFADVQRCTWQWQRRVSEQATATDDSRAAPTTSSEWSLIPGATGRAYTPREADEGCILRVLCTPARRHDGACEFDAANGENILFGDPLLSNEFGTVKRPPSNGGAGRGRHELTRDYLASPHVRVVTYNVLADQYAATESAKNVIFASCPPQ
jgi:2',5'-phosphodiesterase